MKPDSDNDDTSESNRRSHRFRKSAIAVVVLMVLYPLSWGPVMWLLQQSDIDHKYIRLINRVYEPLLPVMRLMLEPVQSAYREYFAWWSR